jgi:transcriptional regulator with XRE-family HTH domain
MNIGKEIKVRRTELNLTQEDLAKKLNVSRTAISNWEQQRNYPDIELLVTISDELDISLDKLLRGDSKMVKELSLDYKKKKRYKILIPIFIFIIIILSGYIYAITNTERYYRYNPELFDKVPQFPDPYKNIEVIDKDTLDKTLLTFSGGQSPKGKNFGKLTYKDKYVYQLEFISWREIPTEIQKELQKNN